MADERLKQDVKADKFTNVSFREYAKVFTAVEVGAYLGANAGIYISDFLTQNKIIITVGTLAGDYIGGSLGSIISYWHNNKGKYIGKENGMFNYARFLKDTLKLFVYDIPVTAISYAITSQLTYEAVKYGWEKWAVAAISSATMMAVWNILNYFVYKAIKNDSDEKLLHKLSS